METENLTRFINGNRLIYIILNIKTFTVNTLIQVFAFFMHILHLNV